MNEKLPKSMFHALTREAKPAEHPPADLLAAFAEQALTEPEKNSIAEHLARCPDCREVVFLASGAVEEMPEHSGELVGAPRTLRTRPASAYAAAAMQPAARIEKQRRWFASGWVWAGSVAAVFVLVGGMFVTQRFKAPPLSQEVATNDEPSLGNRYSLKTEPEKPHQAEVPAVALQAPKTKTRPAPEIARVPAPGKLAAPDSSAEIVAVVNQPPSPKPANQKSVAASSAKPSADSVTVAIGSANAGAAPSTPPAASGFAPNAGQAQQQINSLNATISRAIASSARARSNWRISTQGQLEHLTSDGWTTVLSDQPSGFRVVSLIGNDVWAGGNDGMLFHSSDNGLHWNKVALAGTADVGSIVSIRFSDVRNGEVVTDQGTSWATTDGGATWTKQ